MTLNPEKVLAWAQKWSRTVPPHSRWWIHDELFAALQGALLANSRVFSEEPAWPGVALRTVRVFPKSRHPETRTPCKECGR